MITASTAGLAANGSFASMLRKKVADIN